ncbi:hypothetical protein COP2_023287 [Malus domestica]
MGKSTTDLPVQSPGQEMSHARNPIVIVTPEAVSVTHRENEVCLDTQLQNTKVPNRTTGIFIEGIVEDNDEDSGKDSDPPTRSFLRRRLDEQSRQVEQTVGQKMNNLLKVIRSNGETYTRLLELLAEVVSTRPKTIDLERGDDQVVSQMDPTREWK